MTVLDRQDVIVAAGKFAAVAPPEADMAAAARRIRQTDL